MGAGRPARQHGRFGGPDGGPVEPGQRGGQRAADAQEAARGADIAAERPGRTQRDDRGKISQRRSTDSPVTWAPAGFICSAGRGPAEPDRARILRGHAAVSRRLHSDGSQWGARRSGDLRTAGVPRLRRCDRACLARRTASASASSMFCRSRASAAWMEGWFISDCSLTLGGVDDAVAWPADRDELADWIGDRRGFRKGCGGSVAAAVPASTQPGATAVARPTSPSGSRNAADGSRDHFR